MNQTPVNQTWARKWRPRDLSELVGHGPACQALANALDAGQLHAAYLFTGTRGVGKTSLARIVAKAASCEQGCSATPCNQCDACLAIEACRHPDIIEIDGASRTKVEDMREILDNVPYAPVLGRYKIYIIDEVHMLSNHSFNALLKTLEEPPPHVIFILATTDPQKIPATVVSRCLQFHLRPLPQAVIEAQLRKVLEAEQFGFENAAITALARAARGSMRDGLTLMQQLAAMQPDGITLTGCQQLLGAPLEVQLLALLQALQQQSGTALLNTVEAMFAQGVDFSLALNQLQALLHTLALLQTVPELPCDSEQAEALQQLAQQLSAQAVQLYYQIALKGGQELPFASDPKSGFEMVLLRMLAFQPIEGASQLAAPVASELASAPVAKAPPQSTTPAPAPAPVQRAPAAAVTPAITKAPPKVAATKVAPVPKPSATKAPAAPTLPDTQTKAPPTKAQASSAAPDDWSALVAKLPISGLTRVIAEHCVCTTWGEAMVLHLDESKRSLLNDKHQQRLQQALAKQLQTPVKVSIELGTSSTETPNAHKERQHEAKHQQAQQTIETDPMVQQLVQTFDATIESIELE